MSVNGISWRFPPTGGGESQGYNHPGIAHFGGARDQSLAREVIQNSLDAHGRIGEPVHVEFDLRPLQDDWFGKDELRRHIDACIEAAQGDEKALRAFAEAQELLSEPALAFLRVADRNTTGLHGRKWQALVKESGTSFHEPEGGGRVTAGGSFGIGKNAPFAVSPLRTVFYWTRFLQDGAPRELFQGKAVLMTHRERGAEVQGTGFFGIPEGCLEVEGDAIPAAVRQAEGDHVGTSLWIAGFSNQEGWQERIARRVVASFFGAIASGELTATIEPSAAMDAAGLDGGIDNDSLGHWFEYLTADGAGSTDPDHELDRELDDARLFWEMQQGEPTAVTAKWAELGHCKLWIRADDDEQLPNKVGLMRKTGMLITTEQKGLTRFSGHRRFVALCQFVGDDGNALLREMENPRHDQFEADRVEDPETRKRAETALRRVSQWIRGEIRKVAAPPASADPVRLSELAHLLPDLEPEEEPFGSDAKNGDGRELTFGGSPTVRLKPRRQRRAPTPIVFDEDDPDDDTEVEVVDPPEHRKPRESEPRPSPPPRPAPPRSEAERLEISDVRLVPRGNGDGRYSLSFNAHEDGRATMIFHEFGDSTLVTRDDVRVVDTTGSAQDVIAVRAGERITLDIEADGPIDARAWLVTAVAARGQ